MNMTLAQKQALQALVEGGAKVVTVAYDPTLLEPGADPEGDAVAEGWVQYMREAAPTLVQVIYTR